MNYCSNCGHKIQFGTVEGEHLPRFNCANCGAIHYENPKIIVGCVPVWEDKVMLCRRGIEPHLGWWNIPGGFMENDETIESGAAREMLEETGATVRIVGLLSVFSVPPVNQVHLHFLAEMTDLTYEITPESTEIELFTEGSLPWSEVAFASNRFALTKYFEDRRLGLQRTHIGQLTHDGARWKILGL